MVSNFSCTVSVGVIITGFMVLCNEDVRRFDGTISDVSLNEGSWAGTARDGAGGYDGGETVS